MYKILCNSPMSLQCSLFYRLGRPLESGRRKASVLARNNVANCNNNAPSQNLFVHFANTRLNISSPDAAKMMKTKPGLGRLKTLDNAEQVVSTLERCGCTKDQIATIVKMQPSLLATSAETVLEPKLQLLKAIGMGREECTKTLTWFPTILTVKLENLRANLEHLKTVFPTQDILTRAIVRSPRILKTDLTNLLKPSIAFWEDFGFRGTELTKLLLIDPLILTCSSLTPEQLDLIRRIGIDKKRKMYKYIVSVVARWPIEVLQARVDNLQFCGLSAEEAQQVVMSRPLVLTISEENIKKKMDFAFNHMELSADFIAKHPRMFSMSVEKVMRPRFLVLQSMEAFDGEGEINPLRLFSLLVMTEAKFVGQIIEGHAESAALWTVYKNAIADVSERSRQRFQRKYYRRVC